MVLANDLVLANNWWVLAIRGLFGILFGILAFIVPGAALWGIVLVFGAYVFVDGILALTQAIRGGRKQPRWGALLFEGIVGIIAGIVTFLIPLATALALVLLIAAWAIVTGALEIVTAIRLRKAIEGEWLLVLLGVLSIIFGVLLVIAPITGALVLAMWVGAYALVTGVLQIVLAYKLRSWARTAGLEPGHLRAA